MADKLMYIPNDDAHNYPFYKIQLVVETFAYLMNQLIKVQANNLKKVTKKLWGLA